jgi:hypothetical protein
MRTSRKQERRRFGRFVAFAIALLVLAPILLLALYPLATRWLLSGPRLRALINAKPEFLTLDYDAATSSWPGRLTIKNLRIRGSDPNVQWIIHLDDAEVEFSVLALAQRTFRCTSLRGTGLSFYLRNKIQPAAVKTTDITVLPPIPGFVDPPVREPGESLPPPDPKAWMIDVRPISLDHFDDIWVDAYHFRGTARVDGSFRLRPGIYVQIGPAKLTFESGDVRIGAAMEGISVSGTVDTTFDPFEPLKVPDSRVFGVLSAEVKLVGGFQKLQALGLLFQRVGTLFEGGTGKATIDATIDHGVAKGSIRAAVKGAAVQLYKYNLQGDADIFLQIPNWNLVSGPIDISGTRVSLSDARVFGSKEPRWSGRFDIPTGKIGVTTTATVQAKTRDARPLLAVLGVDLPPWTRGLINLDDFTASARVLLAPATVRVRQLEAAGGTFHIQGFYVREKGATDGALLIESGILSVGVEIDGPKAKVRPLFAKQWFAKLVGAGDHAANTAPSGK